LATCVSQRSLQASELSRNGEIEDDKIGVEAATTDFGGHASLASASSNVNSNLEAGSDGRCGEFSHAPTPPPPGVTLVTGTDDEDGVTLPTTSLTPGSSVTIPVTVDDATGVTGHRNAWIDFDDDGTLDNTLGRAAGASAWKPSVRSRGRHAPAPPFREWWLGIAWRSALSDLTGDAAYPNSPTGSADVDQL